MVGCYVSNGRLKYQDGSDVLAFGINCPDLLLRWIDLASTSNPVPFTASADQDAVLDLMASANMRFVRFFMFGSRAKTFRVGWVVNQATYLAAMDALVAKCEARNILLVPTLFAQQPQIPFYTGENTGAWDNPASATTAMAYSVIDTIVARYKNSPAIGLWEFGNEYDARMELPTPNYSYVVDMEEHAYTTADMSPSTMCNGATARFKARVRTLDATRATVSGGNGWRAYLQNNLNPTEARTNWTRQLQTLLYDDQTDTFTGHFYEASPTYTYGWYGQGFQGFGSYCKRVRQSMEAHGKPFIMGEYGVSTTFVSPDGRSPDTIFIELTNSLQGAGVQLSMPWVVAASPTWSDTYDIRPNVRPAAWAAVVAAHQRYLEAA